MENMQAIKSREIDTESYSNRVGQWLHSPFPFYLNDERKNFGLIVSVSLFVTVFLYFFRTETTALIPENLAWVHGLITFVTLTLNIIFLPRFFPQVMDPVTWTVKKYIWLNVAHLVMIGVLATVIEKLIFCPDETWMTVASHVSVQVPLKGIIPIALITLFLRAQLLQQSLQEAIRTNQELQKIQTLKKEVTKTANQITLYSDTSESLTFNLPDLLFIEADDNYSTVVWKEEGGIQKKLLRVNLKNIETQLNNSFTLRCHRSYIVNVNAISAISGNTNGYKLKINHSDFSIPVSRPKGKEIMEKISQLRNMMELS